MERESFSQPRSKPETIGVSLDLNASSQVQEAIALSQGYLTAEQRAQARSAETLMLKRYDNNGGIDASSNPRNSPQISEEAFSHLKTIVEKFYKGSELLNEHEKLLAITKGFKSFGGEPEGGRNDKSMYLHMRNSFENVLNGKNKKEQEALKLK